MALDDGSGFNFGNLDLSPMDPISVQTPSLIMDNSPISYGFGGDANSALSAGGSTSGVSNSVLQQLARAFGMTDKNGNIASGSLTQLLGMLGIGLGGINSMNATKTATNDITGAIAKANQGISDFTGAQLPKYDPYIAAGTQATNNLSNYQWKPLSPMFPKPGTPANQFNAGGTKLVDIMRKGN